MPKYTAFILLFLLLHSVGYNQSNSFYHVDKLTFKVKSSKDSSKQEKNKNSALVYFKMNGYNGLALNKTEKKRNGTHYYYSYQSKFRAIELIAYTSKKEHKVRSKTYSETLSAIDKQIKALENNGYPFASIQITNQQEEAEVLKLTYKIDSGDFFSIDKLTIKSKNAFHEKTVRNTIGIKLGEPYNEQKIKAIEQIIENSESYKLLQPVEVLFRKGKTELFIYIDKKKSSSADGYVGFQQDQITNKLTLNGYINLQLHNSLNRAEIIDLNWRNSPTKTQDLKIKFEYPYLFGSPIGIGARVDLQKQDTSFVRSDLQFELIYRNPTFRLSIFDQIENSSTLSSVPLTGIRNYSKNTIGTAFVYKPFMPDLLTFYHPKLELSGGIFNYRSDTLENQKNTIKNRKYALGYSHKIDFLTFFHLNNKLTFQGLASSQNLARNEHIYFGGLKSVRGFYELELAGQSIWILQNEIEFKPFSQLALKVIYDYANFIDQKHSYTHSFGFGFGLINNNTQLDIIVANGKLNDNPFLLTDTKVHIGFKSNF